MKTQSHLALDETGWKVKKLKKRLRFKTERLSSNWPKMQEKW